MPAMSSPFLGWPRFSRHARREPRRPAAKPDHDRRAETAEHPPDKPGEQGIDGEAIGERRRQGSAGGLRLYEGAKRCEPFAHILLPAQCENSAITRPGVNSVAGSVDQDRAVKSDDAVCEPPRYVKVMLDPYDGDAGHFQALNQPCEHARRRLIQGGHRLIEHQEMGLGHNPARSERADARHPTAHPCGARLYPPCRRARARQESSPSPQLSGRKAG